MEFRLVEFKKEIEITGFYSYFYSEHSKDFCFGGERHDFWELVYVDDGEIDAVAENMGYKLRQGDVIFHKPMEFHALAANKKDPHNIIVTSFETKSPAMKYFENKIIHVDAQRKKVLSLFLKEAQLSYGSSMNAEPRQAPFGSQQLMAAYMEEFLISLIRLDDDKKRFSRSDSGSKRNVENAIAEQVEQYLLKSMYAPLTLADICARFNMSRSYLCQIFNEAYGEGIISRFIQIKTAEAKKLIRRGEMNVTQIAGVLGYSGIHQFTRSFKKATGMSPTAYAKSIKDSV